MENTDSQKLHIFLDIDGPLATISCYGVGKKNKWGWYMFNPKCVKVANIIHEKYDPIWILSSSWRYQGSLDDINDYFEYRNLKMKIFGFLTKLAIDRDFEVRSELILDYVEKNNIKHYICIDDTPLTVGDDNFVLVNEQGGLGDRKVLDIIENKIRAIKENAE